MKLKLGPDDLIKEYLRTRGGKLTMLRSFLGTGAATRPVPRGAGIRRTRTEPHLPVTWVVVERRRMCVGEGSRSGQERKKRKKERKKSEQILNILPRTP